MKRHYYIIKGIVLLAAMLLAACSSSDSDDSPVATSQNEICLTTNVTSMPSGTRATTIDNNTELQGCDLKIDAYYHDTETKFLDGKTLHYASGWKFWAAGAQEHYYWPFDGSTVTIGDVPTVASTLDFVGYCPYDKPAYIGDPTYNHSTGVSFTCDMSSYMTLASQAGEEAPTIPKLQEFLVSVLNEQTLATQTSAGGALPMVFKHPLAIIKFVITSASGTHVQINSISIAGLNTSGTCTFDGTTMSWDDYGGSGNISIAQTLKNGTGTTETTHFVVIPKDYGSKTLTVNATWDDWSNVTMDVTANVDFNWEPGKKYTYNLTLAKYILIVDTQKFTEQW